MDQDVRLRSLSCSRRISQAQSLKKPDEREEFIEWVEARYSYLKQQLLPVSLVVRDLIYQGISERSYFEMFTVQTDQDLERTTVGDLLENLGIEPSSPNAGTLEALVSNPRRGEEHTVIEAGHEDHAAFGGVPTRFPESNTPPSVGNFMEGMTEDGDFTIPESLARLYMGCRVTPPGDEINGAFYGQTFSPQSKPWRHAANRNGKVYH
ncbi:Uncharacterized protein HZ326_12958 [Fusarium oxysporum f. sp. albedinis]|nr:Uncharacterized protein HZ326_12958 [Fusarium oxysporum f. sp. albedinis]